MWNSETITRLNNLPKQSFLWCKTLNTILVHDFYFRNFLFVNSCIAEYICLKLAFHQNGKERKAAATLYVTSSFRFWINDFKEVSQVQLLFLIELKESFLGAHSTLKLSLFSCFISKLLSSMCDGVVIAFRLL